MARNLRDDWRAAILRDTRVGNDVKVLMIVLADHMKSDGTVSVPRNRLAELLNVNASRITGRLNKAVQLRLLDRISRGTPGQTAVYKALRQGAHVRTPTRVRIANPSGVHTSAPFPSVAKGAHVQAAISKHPPEPNSAPNENGHKNAATTDDHERCTTCGTRDALDNHSECHNCALTRTA